MEYVRIVRFSNEGFKPTLQFDPFYKYNHEISEFYNMYDIDIRDPLLSLEKEWIGCFSFFYKFGDERHSILSHRRINKINIGYLPVDLPVYVRTMNPSLNAMLEFHKMVQNPADLSWHRFSEYSAGDTHHWAKMKLSVAVSRSEEYLKNANVKAPPEALAEIFLTPEEVQQIVHIKTLPSWRSISRRYPLIKTVH